MIKKILLFFVCVVSFQGCYLLEQSLGQLDLRFNQVDINKAIDQEKNPETKYQLSEVHFIKQYAERNLLLQKTENFTGYYHTDQPGITFVVTASSQNKLEPYTWWFPIIGDVPYKGFFDKKDALELEKELQSKGFDTWIFTAPAYSSIGWFKDPITTPMLKKGIYYLSETIIHEMVHVTLYIKDQGDFNEQLASFVAHKGAIEYLETKPNGDLIIQREKQNRKKRSQLNKTLQVYLKQLEQLYSTNQSLSDILKKRDQIFNNTTSAILNLFPQANPEDWQFNNARLLQYRRYQPENTKFKEMWQNSNQSWQKFWEQIRNYIELQEWD
jgi:predicted aminopeptidase